ncbi:MAG TPA: metal ABC transporter substrate-binding protein [Acidimicrobiia bacterium]|nr:metal ABC transporter substrate-binding protein [Acidimicrobiia bacterium]
MRCLGLVLLVSGLVSACAEAGLDDSDLVVVTTTNILGDVVSELVADAGQVEVMIEPGVDPHDFSPSASQGGLLRSADLVVANGLGLEAGMTEALAAAEAEGANVLTLADELQPLRFGSDDLDPHFFLDPVRMADAVGLISAALAEVDHTTDWAAPAESLEADLASLHREIEDHLAGIPPESRKLVTNHDSLGYFADRYGFEIVGTVIPAGSTLAEPSASDLADLVDVLRREGLTAIFAETTAPAALAEAVAAELGDAEVHELHTESVGPPGSDTDSYSKMMRANAAIIASALGG